MEELHFQLRREPPPGDDVVVVRGGDDNAEKLRRHAERTHRAYVLDGKPFYGLSAYCAVDELAERRLYRQLASYRVVRPSTVGRLRTAGFWLLPTFARSHFSVVLPGSEDADLDRLLACFDPASHNPGHGRFHR
jgi:hypothetical protein